MFQSRLGHGSLLAISQDLTSVRITAILDCGKIRTASRKQLLTLVYETVRREDWAIPHEPARMARAVSSGPSASERLSVH